MAKRVRVKKRKYMGDDCYSWAVFVDGVPKVTGCGSREADHYVRVFRKELGEK